MAGCGPGKEQCSHDGQSEPVSVRDLIDGRLLYGQHFQAGSLGWDILCWIIRAVDVHAGIKAV